MLSTPRRFESLDSLRGILACLVVLLHLRTASPLTTMTFVQNGFLAVDFFFVLSGFVIAAGYDGKLLERREALAFLWLRFWRLYPLHFVMLAAFVALELFAFLAYPYLLQRTPFTQTNSVRALVSNLFLVQSLHLYDWPTWNWPAWSISAEVWTYALFALVSWGVARQRQRWLPWLIPVMLGILYLGPQQMSSTADLGLLRSVAGFVAGVCCWRVYRAGQRPAWNWNVAEVVSVAAVIAFICAPKGPHQLAAPFLMAFMIFVLAQEQGALTKWLRLPALQWLGARSYSIYMVHALVVAGFELLCLAIQSHYKVNLFSQVRSGGAVETVLGRTPLEGWLVVAGALACVMPAAAFAYRFIEEPARRWSRRKLAAMAGSRASPGAPSMARVVTP